MLGMWTHKATQLLISCYAQLKEEFGGKVQKKKDCWLRISESMQGYGYNISSSECDRKWRSLLKTYRRHLDESKKTGRGGGKKWAYFDEVDSVVGMSASAVPIAKAAVPKKFNSKSCLSLSAADDITASASGTATASTSCVEVATGAGQRKKRKSSAPEWFEQFVQEFREDQAKRHGEFMTHLKVI